MNADRDPLRAGGVEPGPTGSDGAGLRFDPGLIEAIEAHLLEDYPEEACGGLLGRAADDGSVHVDAVRPSRNTRTRERRRRYLIGPEDVLALEREARDRGLEVVGYYHSHPDAPAAPSDFDREHAWPWYVYVIASIRDGELTDLTAWRLSDDRARLRRIAIRQTECGGPRERPSLDTPSDDGFR